MSRSGELHNGNEKHNTCPSRALLCTSLAELRTLWNRCLLNQKAWRPSAFRTARREHLCGSREVTQTKHVPVQTFHFPYLMHPYVP